jgi:putative heme-binding domain-containing protein
MISSLLWILLACGTTLAWQNVEATPEWIWSPEHAAGHVPQTSCYFRKTVSLPATTSGHLAVAADDAFELYVNGVHVGRGAASQGIQTFDVSRQLRAGRNLLAVAVTNREGTKAGLAVRMVVIDKKQKSSVIATDASWRSFATSAANWERPSFSDRRWPQAKTIGRYPDFVARQTEAAQRQADMLAGDQPSVSLEDPAVDASPETLRQPPALALPAAQAAINPQPPVASAAPAASAAPTNLTNAAPLRGSVASPAEPPAASQEDTAALAAAALASESTSPSVEAANDGNRSPVALAAATGAGAPSASPAVQHLRVPAGFAVEQVATHRLVGSITAFTFNERGQPIVAREDGTLLALIDDNRDGKYEGTSKLGQLTQTCQGLLSHQGELFVSGKGAQGLGVYRLRDSNRDGLLDEATPVVRMSGDNLEHGPHGLALGADGMVYAMVGNHSPLDLSAHRDAWQGPYRHPYEGDLLTPRFEDPGGHAVGIKAPGGYVVRFRPDGQQVEYFAGGFRNAYDLAFNAQGELFAHDSDMESDQGTTWYRPTRAFHVLPGAEIGWRSGWATWPDYYPDGVPGIADTGRGSPTGMVVYNHRQFPATYANAIFSGDWSEGRIWVLRCAEQNASYRAKAEVFMSGSPLNVTDLEVGPDGSLYVVTGGRGSQGNVYRVHATQPAPQPAVARGVERALRLPQIHAAWARQQAAEIQREAGIAWSSALVKAIVDAQRGDAERLQALYLAQTLGKPLSSDTLIGLTADARPALRRQATFYLGLQADPASAQRLRELLQDEDSGVRRRACEALARRRDAVPLESLRHLLASPNRAETWAARNLLQLAPPEALSSAILTDDQIRVFLHGSIALLQAHPDPATARAVLNRCAQWMTGYLADEDFLVMLRVHQLALHRGPLHAADVPEFSAMLAEEYPSTNPILNHELIRTLAYLQNASIGERYLAELDRGLPAADAIHLALHLTFIQTGWTPEQKQRLFRHLTTPAGVGNGVPGYFQMAASQFGNSLSDEELAQSLASGAENPAAATAVVLRLPEKLNDLQREQLIQLDRTLAATVASSDAAAAPAEAAKRLQVTLVAVLARDGQPASHAYLREVYDRDPSRRLEIALGLAEYLQPESLTYVTRSLSLLSPRDAQSVVTKLRAFSRWPSDAESHRQLIQLAERLGAEGGDDAIHLLEAWQGFAKSDDALPLNRRLQAWKNWFAATFPGESLDIPAANSPSVVSATASNNTVWTMDAVMSHLSRGEQAGIGSPDRGRLVFEKAQCAKCHRLGDQGEMMGPDLTTVSKRFLKQEIVDSILNPSRVISDQYAARVVTTTDGRTFTGIVAAGVDGDSWTILDSTGQKLIVRKDQVEAIDPARVSAMPEGLLNPLTPDEIIDLFAYLVPPLAGAPTTPPASVSELPTIRRPPLR